MTALGVLDVRLQGLSGLDFQRELVESDIHLPIIFITGTAIYRCRCGQ
jgi:FixJ family two-component response regulator